MKTHRPACLGNVYAQGFQACRAGALRAANPHKGDEAGADAWFTGWDEATERGWAVKRAESKPSPDE
jgi:ribosome modulation factor